MTSDSGQAPLAGYKLSTQRNTMLDADLLGSVPLVTDTADAEISAGDSAYNSRAQEQSLQQGQCTSGTRPATSAQRNSCQTWFATR